MTCTQNKRLEKWYKMRSRFRNEQQLLTCRMKMLSACFRAALALAVVGLLAVDGQTYPNSQVLDDNGEYVLYWDTTSGRRISAELQVNTTGWVSFGILSDDGALLDIWWGGFSAADRSSYLIVRCLFFIHVFFPRQMFCLSPILTATVVQTEPQTQTMVMMFCRTRMPQ